jgi:hypothetical protein
MTAAFIHPLTGFVEKTFVIADDLKSCRTMKRHECRAPERGLQPASTPESEKNCGEQHNL